MGTVTTKLRRVIDEAKLSVLQNMSWYFADSADLPRLQRAWDIFEDAITRRSFKTANILHSVRSAELISSWHFHPEIVISALFHHIHDRSIIQQHADEFPTQLQIIEAVRELRDMLKQFYFASIPGSYYLDDHLDFRAAVVCLASALARVQEGEWAAFYPERFNIPFERPSDVTIGKIIFSVCVPVTHMLRLDSATRWFEDIIFQQAFEVEYRLIREEILPRAKDRLEVFLFNAQSLLEDEFQADIEQAKVEIESRVKHDYSIFLSLCQWLRKRGHNPTLLSTDLTIQQEVREQYCVNDLLGLRLVFHPTLTESPQDLEVIRQEYVSRCIQALQGAYQFVSQKQKQNKDGKYNAWHLRFASKDQIMLEVQVRDRPVHEAAEGHDAAHWLYKLEETPEIIRGDIIREEVHRSILQTWGAYFKNHVIVMTDQGDIQRLPWRSTVLDFILRLGLHKQNTLPTPRRVLAPQILNPHDSKLSPPVELRRVLLTNDRYIFDDTHPLPMSIELVDAATLPESRETLLLAMQQQKGMQRAIAHKASEMLQRCLGAEKDFWRRDNLLPTTKALANIIIQKYGMDDQHAAQEIVIGGDDFIYGEIHAYKSSLKERYQTRYKEHQEKKYAYFAEHIASYPECLFPSEHNVIPRMLLQQQHEVYQALCCCPIFGDAIAIARYELAQQPISLVHQVECTFTQHLSDKIEFKGIKRTHWDELEVLDQLKLGLEIVIFNIRGTASKIFDILQSHHINIADISNPHFTHLIGGPVDRDVHIEDLGLEIDSVYVRKWVGEQAGESLLATLKTRIQTATKNYITMQRGMYPGKYISEWLQIKDRA